MNSDATELTKSHKPIVYACQSSHIIFSGIVVLQLCVCVGLREKWCDVWWFRCKLHWNHMTTSVLWLTITIKSSHTTCVFRWVAMLMREGVRLECQDKVSVVCCHSLCFNRFRIIYIGGMHTLHKNPVRQWLESGLDISTNYSFVWFWFQELDHRFKWPVSILAIPQGLMDCLNQTWYWTIWFVLPVLLESLKIFWESEKPTWDSETLTKSAVRVLQ